MEKKEIEVRNILKKNVRGVTITAIVGDSGFSRTTVRTILAKLEGGKKVDIRKIGMAKLYTLTGHKNLQADKLK